MVKRASPTPQTCPFQRRSSRSFMALRASTTCIAGSLCSRNPHSTPADLFRRQPEWPRRRSCPSTATRPQEPTTSVQAMPPAFTTQFRLRLRVSTVAAPQLSCSAAATFRSPRSRRFAQHSASPPTRPPSPSLVAIPAPLTMSRKPCWIPSGQAHWPPAPRYSSSPAQRHSPVPVSTPQRSTPSTTTSATSSPSATASVNPTAPPQEPPSGTRSGSRQPHRARRCSSLQATPAPQAVTRPATQWRATDTASTPGLLCLQCGCRRHHVC